MKEKIHLGAKDNLLAKFKTMYTVVRFYQNEWKKACINDYMIQAFINDILGYLNIVNLTFHPHKINDN